MREEVTRGVSRKRREKKNFIPLCRKDNSCSSPYFLQEQMKLSINPTVPRREGREGQRHTEREAEADKNTPKNKS